MNLDNYTGFWKWKPFLLSLRETKVPAMQYHFVIQMNTEMKA